MSISKNKWMEKIVNENQLAKNETYISMKYDIQYFVDGLIDSGYLHSDLRVDVINFFINIISVGSEPLRALLNEKD